MSRLSLKATSDKRVELPSLRISRVYDEGWIAWEHNLWVVEQCLEERGTLSWRWRVSSKDGKPVFNWILLIGFNCILLDFIIRIF